MTHLVTTTLGYGNVFPTTNREIMFWNFITHNESLIMSHHIQKLTLIRGMLFCSFYAMFGVPLFYFLMRVTSNFVIDHFLILYQVRQ